MLELVELAEASGFCVHEALGIAGRVDVPDTVAA